MPRCISLTLLVVAYAIAEEAPVIIVTAERGESELARAPASVSVIREEELRERGYPLGLLDWLNETPGVLALGPNGGIDGGTGRISIRGVDPSFTVTLLDGIPVSDASAADGGINPAVVNPAGTARIEVLKGAQSGLYGSGAVGGVLNIISLRPTAEHHGAVRATGGSFGTGSAEVAATGPLGGQGGYAFGASGLASDGFSVTTDRDAKGDPKDYEDDGVQRLSAIGRLEYRPVEALTVHAAGLAMRNAQEYDTWAAIPLVDDEASHTFTTMQRLALGAAWKQDRLSIVADAAITATDRIFRDGSSPVDSLYASQDRWLALRAIGELRHGFRVGAGIDDRLESGEQRDDGQPNAWDESTGQTGGYVDGGWSHANAEASVVGRLDHHRDFGSHASGRAAAAVFAEDLAWKLRAAIGNGFQAPTLYQLHGSYPPFGYSGNPDLEPQTALQYEVGADLQPHEALGLSLTAFRTDYRRRIVNPTWVKYENSDSDEEVQGLEAQATAEDVAGSGVDATAWYTLLDSDDGTGEESYYTPENTGGLRLVATQRPGGSEIWQSLGVRLSEGMRTSAGFTEGYTVVDIALGVRFDRTWEAVLRVDNALDESYELQPYYTTAPRGYYLTVGARF